MPSPHDRLIDVIYEAGFSPAAWQTVFDGLCAVTESASAALILADAALQARGVASAHVDARFQSTIRDPRWGASVRARRALDCPAHRFFPFDALPRDLASDDDMVATALREVGLGPQLGTIIALPADTHVFFTLERRYGESAHAAEQVDQADALRPHLARAALIAARLGLQQAQAAADVMQRMGLPAAVLTATGRVLAGNALLDTAAVLRPAAHGRLALPTPAADALLHDALQALRGQHLPPVASIPVAMGASAPATVVHVLPLHGMARDLFTGGMALVVEARLTHAGQAPSPAMLHALFDLTPREAQLAVALCRGDTVAAFAQARGIRTSTARSHLERVLDKTATHQQSQLVALLRSAPWPDGEDA